MTRAHGSPLPPLLAAAHALYGAARTSHRRSSILRGWSAVSALKDVSRHVSRVLTERVVLSAAQEATSPSETADTLYRRHR